MPTTQLRKSLPDIVMTPCAPLSASKESGRTLEVSGFDTDCTDKLLLYDVQNKSYTTNNTAQKTWEDTEKETECGYHHCQI